MNLLYRLFAQPSYFAAGTMEVVRSANILPGDFLLLASWDFTSLVFLMVGIVYAWSEYSRTYKVDSPFIRRARRLMAGGFVSLMLSVSIVPVDSMIFRAFGTAPSFYSFSRLSLRAVEVGGVLAMGVGVLALRNKGPPTPLNWTEPEAPSQQEKRSVARVLAFVGVLSAGVGFYGGFFFPLQGLILLLVGALLFLAGCIGLRSRPKGQQTHSSARYHIRSERRWWNWVGSVRSIGHRTNNYKIPRHRLGETWE